MAVNESWTRLARRRTARGGRAAWATTTSARLAGTPAGTAHAARGARRHRGGAHGSRAGFALEYPWPARTGSAGPRCPSCHWTVPRAAPSSRSPTSPSASRPSWTPSGAAQELAHFTRVSTMGELTASLAHELNQPLTGILSQCPGRPAVPGAATPPALGELREILTDIVEDDRRAGEVIQRLRDLLRKGEPNTSSRSPRVGPGRGQARGERRAHPQRHGPLDCPRGLPS